MGVFDFIREFILEFKEGVAEAKSTMETIEESPLCGQTTESDSADSQAQRRATTTPKLAAEVMNKFEEHLRRTNRVEPGSVEYESSDYSHLVEAMIIAFLARAAFVERYWKTDVHSMLRRWLPEDLCRPFFNGEEGFINAFRAEMKKRAQKWYNTAYGELQKQYIDIEAGIGETNPYSGFGAPFG